MRIAPAWFNAATIGDLSECLSRVSSSDPDLACRVRVAIQQSIAEALRQSTSEGTTEVELRLTTSPDKVDFTVSSDTASAGANCARVVRSHVRFAAGVSLSMLDSGDGRVRLEASASPRNAQEF